MPIEYASMCAAGLCDNCEMPVMIKLKTDTSFLQEIREHLKAPDKTYTGPVPEIEQIWPTPAGYYAHASLPNKVNDLFVDLQKMVEGKLSPSMIVSGCSCLYFSFGDRFRYQTGLFQLLLFPKRG